MTYKVGLKRLVSAFVSVKLRARFWRRTGSVKTMFSLTKIRLECLEQPIDMSKTAADKEITV